MPVCVHVAPPSARARARPRPAPPRPSGSASPETRGFAPRACLAVTPGPADSPDRPAAISTRDDGRSPPRGGPAPSGPTPAVVPARAGVAALERRVRPAATGPRTPSRWHRVGSGRPAGDLRPASGVPRTTRDGPAGGRGTAAARWSKGPRRPAGRSRRGLRAASGRPPGGLRAALARPRKGSGTASEPPRRGRELVLLATFGPLSAPFVHVSALRAGWDLPRNDLAQVGCAAT
jgi:hypothetical protein